MVFVDTSFFFALASPGNHDHKRVRGVYETFDRKRLP
jgi:predicted nucleic acid-binding protein